MPKRFAEQRDTPSGAHEVARDLGIPVVEDEAFDQPRLMLDKQDRPWFIAIPSWWYSRKKRKGAA